MSWNLSLIYIFSIWVMADRGEVGVTKVQITWEGKNIVR